MEISFGSYKMRLEILLLCVFIIWVMFGHILCSCSTINLTEGLTIRTTLGPNTTTKEGMGNMNSSNSKIGGNNVAYDPEFADSKSPDWIMNPKNWGKPTTQANRKEQTIPLPTGQLGLFDKTEMKSKCCPNTYSSSSGCACMTVKQQTYLQDRGGNNVPQAEY